MTYKAVEYRNKLGRKLFRKYYGYYPEHVPESQIHAFHGIDRQLGILGTTCKPCSCWMCGNPRRHFGELTRQEKIARLKEKESQLPCPAGGGGSDKHDQTITRKDEKSWRLQSN